MADYSEGPEDVRPSLRGQTYADRDDAQQHLSKL